MAEKLQLLTADQQDVAEFFDAIGMVKMAKRAELAEWKTRMKF